MIDQLGGSASFVKDAQEQMFGADVVVIEGTRLFLCQFQDAQGLLIVEYGR